MLKLEGVRHAYDGSSVLSYPDWEVEEGGHAVILGTSGCGKTTLLHLIAGLMSPTEGILKVSGEAMSSMTQSALDSYRGKNIGIVFQKPHLVSALTVKENLVLAQYLGKCKRDTLRIDEVMNNLGIKELTDRKIHQISQGQAQRVSIARAVINSPKLLLADEPTASLDDENCEKVIELLKTQAENSKATLIIATHDQRVKGEFENRLML